MALRNKVLFTNEFGQLGINGASYEAGKDIIHTHLLGCNDTYLKFCNPLASGTPTMRLQLHTGYAQGGGDVGASCCGIFVAGGQSAEAPVALIGSCLDLNSPKSALNDASPELLFQTGASHYNWRIAAQETVDKGFEIASSTTVNDNAYTSSYTNRLVIEGDTGHVGIGTSSPNYILDSKKDTTSITHNLKTNVAAAANNCAEIAFQLWSGAGSGANDFGGTGVSRPSVVLRALSEDNSARGAFVVGTFSGGSTNSTLTEKMRITSSGNVGIGTSSPDYDLHVQDDVEANIKIETNNDGASNFAGLRMFKSRGTNASPTTVANGDTVAQILMYARDGGDWNNTARMYAKICGTVTSTDTPTDLIFSTGTTGLNDRLTIKSDGNVGIGSQPNRLSSTGRTLTITESDGANPANIELIGGNATGEVAGRIRASYTGNITSSEIQFCLGCNGADNGGILFLTKDSGGLSDRARIDSCGAFGIGNYGSAALRTNQFFLSDYCSKAQIEGTGISTSSLQIIANSTNEYPVLGLSRSRGTTIGSHTLVANNDNLGAVTFFASDGSSGFTQGAGVSAKINNICPAVTIASNQIPVDLIFSINDGGTDCGVSNVGRFSHAGNFLVGCNLACGNGMISALEKSGYGVLEARATTDFTNGQGGVIVTRAVDCDSTAWANGCHTAFAHLFYTNGTGNLAACINSLGGINVGLCLTTGTLVDAGTCVLAGNCVIAPTVCGSTLMKGCVICGYRTGTGLVGGLRLERCDTVGNKTTCFVVQINPDDNCVELHAACASQSGILCSAQTFEAPVMYTSDCFCTGGCVYAAGVVYSPNCLCSPIARITSNLIPSGLTCCNANIKTYTWPAILCGPTSSACSYCYHLVRWSYDPFNWGNGGFMEFTLTEWYYSHRGGRKKYRVHSNGYYGGTGSAPQVVLVENTNRGGSTEAFGIKVVGPTVVDGTAPGQEYFDVYLATRCYHAVQVQMETNAQCTTSNPPQNACIYICTSPTAQTDGTCFPICQIGSSSTECKCLGIAPFACGLEICGGVGNDLSRHDATLYVKADNSNDWGIWVDKPDGAYLQKWVGCSACAQPGLYYITCNGSTERTEFYSCPNGITATRVCFYAPIICGSSCVLAGSCVKSGIICGNGCIVADGELRVDRICGLNIGGDSGQQVTGAGGGSLYQWGYQAGGAWSSPFPDLVIGYHTGLIFGANCTYGGTRFYSDHPHSSTAQIIFLVGCGNCNVCACYNLCAGDGVYSPIICATSTMQVGGNDVLTTASSVGANFCASTDVNNRVVTANGDAGSLCGEANLTFDGSTLNVTGAITASGDITSTSDERVKSNISEINGAIDIVSNLCGRIFIKDNKENVGVIAQEVEKILPQVVRDNPDGLKSVSYGNIVGVLIEAIKDQNKTIRDQNCRIENLEKIVQGR
jgi:hypothetical protein